MEFIEYVSVISKNELIICVSPLKSNKNRRSLDKCRWILPESLIYKCLNRYNALLKKLNELPITKKLCAYKHAAKITNDPTIKTILEYKDRIELYKDYIQKNSQSSILLCLLYLLKCFHIQRIESKVDAIISALTENNLNEIDYGNRKLILHLLDILVDYEDNEEENSVTTLKNHCIFDAIIN